jgi:hypothetical protein
MSPHADPRTLAWIQRCIALADREHTPEQIEAAERALAQPRQTPVQEALPLV